jgi:hypothetical protein
MQKICEKGQGKNQPDTVTSRAAKRAYNFFNCKRDTQPTGVFLNPFLIRIVTCWGAGRERTKFMQRWLNGLKKGSFSGISMGKHSGWST